MVGSGNLGREEVCVQVPHLVGKRVWLASMNMTEVAGSELEDVLVRPDAFPPSFAMEKGSRCSGGPVG